ncbi:FAD/NAD(P)-binding domain-containing protein [Daldinia caldariorum]|uniref:FAD/NAD(P)-binding domain-containing protein n=1 Tax=Daldinia caldariorum TaxID=326644 RepID=UPI002008DDCB|nr:FAD/NAD(P)-binding domain-containing protein [Daldinia caldariorum]KAI1465822.1 FAD/NAD(P)-binding domain-containing protein [Daldinia caldariorum]
MELRHSASPTIAIIGAGIAGLALAIGLVKRDVPVTIYEAADQFSTVGAGIGLGPNSLDAMDAIDPRFGERYEEVKTQNEKPDFKHSIFDVLYAEEGFGEKRGWKRGLIGAPYFTRSGAHRRDLLDIMESLVPKGIVKFGKRAYSVEQVGNKVLMRFQDGTVETADAVVGCDGVKGITRRTVLGNIAPEEIPPTFYGMYMYRGIIPIREAKEILGTHAGDAKFFMAMGKAVVVYPISQGKEENFGFMISKPDPWMDGDAAVPCTKEEMLEDLEGFDHRLLKLLDYAIPLRWPMWHHPQTTTFYNGRVCLLGDVAHASSPHQAAGAGQGLEDAAVLSHLLTLVKTSDEIETAFRVYDAVRRPRAQKVVLTSAEAGLIYTWRGPTTGSDMHKIVENANRRMPWIWLHDLDADIKTADDSFYKLVRKQQDLLHVQDGDPSKAGRIMRGDGLGASGPIGYPTHWVTIEVPLPVQMRECGTDRSTQFKICDKIALQS